MPDLHANQRVCGLCDAMENVDTGTIVHSTPTRVAGVAIDLGDTALCLRECRRCGLRFKDPPIDEAKLLACQLAALWVSK